MRRVLLVFVLVVGATLPPIGVGATESGDETSDTGAFWGTITDAVTGHGVSDICVWLSQNGDEVGKSGYTNHEGVYEISGLAPGTYDVDFVDCELERYTTATVAASITAGTAAEVNQELALRAGAGAITGLVTDAASGEPISGSCVKLYHADDDILVTYTYTAEDGSYLLVADAGVYRVRFKPCESESHVEQWFDGASGWEGSATVTVSSGIYLDGVNAELEPNLDADGVLWGYVVDGASGDPVSGYCTSLYSGEDKIATVLTGEAGGWELHAAPGEYRLKVWACEGHEDLGTVWYLDGDSFDAARVVELEPTSEQQLDTIVVGDVRFRDVLESSYHADIVWLAENGITLGCNELGTEFCPSETVTRAQMAAFLHRALGDLLHGDGEVEFEDVVAGSTFAADIEWLASVGITLGCNTEGTRFCPDDEISRGQMAAFLHRALADILTPHATAGFGDDDGSTFESDIEWLAAVGITGGCNADGTAFCPDDAVIRAHMAAFLHRALGDA